MNFSNFFIHDVIELLLKIQWWNWDIEKIRANIDVLVNNDECIPVKSLFLS
ncbi:MAG: hypothetical protein LBB25_00045 [Holosporaceae bacterium]|nr:hypothetical protein [Holosporaceae bacterium]